MSSIRLTVMSVSARRLVTFQDVCLPVQERRAIEPQPSPRSITVRSVRSVRTLWDSFSQGAEVFNSFGAPKLQPAHKMFHTQIARYMSHFIPDRCPARRTQPCRHGNAVNMQTLDTSAVGSKENLTQKCWPTKTVQRVTHGAAGSDIISLLNTYQFTTGL